MRRPKLLILDDDEELLQTARALLERAGYDVAVYAGRFDRLGVALRERPDLVLLDVNMPVVSGEELYALWRAHESLRAVPVVFFSSNDETELRLLARASGAHGYIPKSAVGNGLAQHVARHLRASAPGV